MTQTSNSPRMDGGYGSVQSVTEVSTTQYFALGTEHEENGRTFRYASSSGPAIGIGSLCAVAAPTGNHVSVAYASGGAVGASAVTVTLGATAATENQYAGGTLVVIDGTGQGQIRAIESHPAADASATLEVTVNAPFTVAIASGAELSLVENEHANVVVHPGMAATTGNNAPVGWVGVDIPAGTSDTQYFWVQAKGLVAALKNGTAATDGLPMSPANATADAGQVEPATEGAGALDPIVGYVVNEGDSTSDGDHVLLRAVIG